jgi:hypothetical protein
MLTSPSQGPMRQNWIACKKPHLPGLFTSLDTKSNLLITRPIIVFPLSFHKVPNNVAKHFTKFPTMLQSISQSSQQCCKAFHKVHNNASTYFTKFPTVLQSISQSSQHCCKLFYKIPNTVAKYFTKFPTVLQNIAQSSQQCCKTLHKVPNNVAKK